MLKLATFGLASMAICAMADPAPEPAAGAAATPAPAPAKAKTVLDDMDSRRMFKSPEDAAAYLNKLDEDIPGFGTNNFVLRGITPNTDTGALDFDPKFYDDLSRVMVSVLTNRVKGGPTKVNAIVVTPVPTIEAILADEAAMQWLTKIIDKELNHVAVRGLRDPKDGLTIDEITDAMPVTLADFITSSRGDGGALDVFNELAKGIIDAIAKQNKAWSKMRLTKGELRSAMASRAYAAEYYPTLEDRGEGKESLFVMALQFGKKVAVAKGMDPAIFDRWLSTRDEAKLAAQKDDDDDSDEVDFDSLTFEEPKTTTAPTPAVAADTTTAAAATDTIASGDGTDTVAGADESATMTDAELEAATAPDTTVGAEGTDTTESAQA